MITCTKFGTTAAGENVDKYTLTNDNGASVCIITYGGTITEINVPDKNGVLGDVVCGYDTIAEYEQGDQNQGALIGRFANRIKAGRFTLGGKEYILAKNDNGINHLHGGDVGYNRRIWDAQVCGDTLSLSLFSPDGEEGYPGNLTLNVKYTFNNDNLLTIEYKATTDADTVCNFTNHAYFNLAGYASCDVKDHIVEIKADYITETDDELIPTGNLSPVDGTMYDLRTPKAMAGEYDDNFVLNADGNDSDEAKHVCTVSEPNSGRVVKVYTTLPGMQLYTGNFMGTGIPFKGGVPSRKHHAFCLETQRWPDSPNHENFTSCVLKPGQVFTSQTSYQFLTQND